MKKVLVIMVFAVFSFANAQKGTYLVSGNVNYNSEKNSDVNSSDYTNFSFNPKIGYQFTDKLTLGFESALGQSKWTSDFNNNTKRDNFSVGSFIRYSKSINDSFSFFADLRIGYQSKKDTYSNFSTPETISKANGFYTTLQPMISLKIKNNFGVNFGLGGIGYNTLNYKEADNRTSSFNITFGQAYTIGIQKNF